MLSEQALAGPAPELVMVLGTRTATWDPAPFYKGRELVMRALKRRWPQVEYTSLSEFTTGKGTHSGGLRRPHWNMPLRGIPADSAGEAAAIAIPVWCAHVDALPHAQYVEALRSVPALMRYVAGHFTKTDQMPPQDGRWRGKQRFNSSRGYFAPYTRAEARERAHRSIQFEREVWKAARAGSSDPVGDAVESMARLARTTWTLRDAGAVGPEHELEQLMRRAANHRARWEAAVAVPC